MRKLSVEKICLCGSVLTFYLISKMLFDKVFLASKVIIDEEFHIPQGLAYCNFTFNYWHPKITTLPGLYLISGLILGPLNLCSTYWLRFTNLLAAVINMFLYYICFNLFCSNQKPAWINLVSSINLAILPPLYFFSNLYYTDVLSVTFILLFIIAYKTNRHMVASIFGMASVVMRQTNIIWVAMIFGQYVTQELLLHSSVSKSKRLTELDISLRELKICVVHDLKNAKIIKKLPLDFWLNILAYLMVLSSFAVFLIVNGGIVVGDKTAHTASLHIPQFLYFSTFCLVFSWPFFVPYVFPFIKFIWNRKTLSLSLVMFLSIIIYFNTVVHPYLLADNRHYTFYIWNRFYEIYNKPNIVPAVFFIFATTLVLILQKMIEIRYFFIPYLILRFQFKNVQMWQVYTEFIFNCIVNLLTFCIFFNKDIYWSDYDYVQKLIW